MMKTGHGLSMVAFAALVLWLAGGLTFAGPPPSTPQPAAQPRPPASAKIAYVDFQQILDQSVVGKKAQDELKKRFGSTQDLLKQKGQELQDLQTQIEKQKDVLSGLALEEKKNMFAVKYRSYMQQKMMLQEQYNNEFIKLVKPMQKEIVDIITAIGKEKGYTMIFKYDISAQTEESTLAEFLFFPSAIAYIDTGVNITGEVLGRYDAKHR